MRAPVLAMLLVVSLPGCFSGFLDEHADTKLAFVCAVLDPAEDPLTIHTWGDQSVDALVLALEDVTGRAIAVDRHASLAPGTDPAAWADDHPFRARGGLHLHVVWQPDLPGNATGTSWAPGIVAVSTAAVEQGAARLGIPSQAVADSLLLHHAGHALGLVNHGIPVQTPAIQEREGPPRHAPNPADIMHVGWEDIETMQWHGPPAYSDADRADWAGARTGVCA